MYKCPRCHSTEIRKDGVVKQKQRYRCKTCDYRFTVQRMGKALEKRREAFILYLIGLDLRKIGKLINTSHVTVYNWVKDIKGEMKQMKEPKINLVQMEGLNRYVEQLNNKKETKGLLLIEFTDEGIDVMLVMKDR